MCFILPKHKDRKYKSGHERIINSTKLMKYVLRQHEQNQSINTCIHKQFQRKHDKTNVIKAIPVDNSCEFF